jgi:hypothetical protein
MVEKGKTQIKKQMLFDVEYKTLRDYEIELWWQSSYLNIYLFYVYKNLFAWNVMPIYLLNL